MQITQHLEYVKCMAVSNSISGCFLVHTMTTELMQAYASNFADRLIGIDTVANFTDHLQDEYGTQKS